MPRGGTLKGVTGGATRPRPGVVVWATAHVWNDDEDPAVLCDLQGRLVTVTCGAWSQVKAAIDCVA